MAKVKTVVETKTLANAATLLRKGARAYVGLYGAAFERAQMRTNQLIGATDGLFDTLVIRGTDIEARAVNMAKFAQIKASDRVSSAADRVADFVPVAANSRVSELEAEVAALNARIAKFAKPVKKSAPKSKAYKAKMATDKTVKKAA